MGGTGECMGVKVAVLLIVSTLSVAQQLTVGAAADLSAALPELAAQYKKQTGVEVKLSFGSSGNLTTQIENGAPFDIFFSADEEYPRQLVDKGLAEKDSVYRYAAGRLVLWVPNGSNPDVQKLGINLLLEPSVKKH